MKIYCIMPSLFSGGAERQLCLLMEQLKKRGFDVTFISYSNRKDMYSLPNGVKRVRITGMNHAIQFVKLMFFFTKSVKKEDVLISFCRDNNNVALLANMFTQCKVVVGERNLLQADNRESRLAFKLYRRKADYIVSNSHSQEKYLKETLFDIKDRISCIINYTDIKYFHPDSSFKNEENKKIIGIFARYHPQKNYENFVKAVKQTVEKGYTDFKFCWHGSKFNTNGSYNEHYLKFESLIETYHLENYIELKDPTKNVFETINYYDAICLPSLFEGFSNSLAEAISCGKIVLASNTSDNPYMAKDGYNGFTFNPLNPDDMAAGIISYLKLNNRSAQEYENNSRALALELFDLDKFTKSYIDIIKT